MARKARKDSYTGIDIEWLDDGKIRVYYGITRGWATYYHMEEVKIEVLPWIATTIINITKELSDLARLQNIILGVQTK